MDFLPESAVDDRSGRHDDGVFTFLLFSTRTANAAPDFVPAISIPTVKIAEVGTTVGVPWIANYVGGVYEYAAGIAMVLAGVMVVIGGFQYQVSGGDSSKVSADALIGMLLVLGSYVILNTINTNLVNPVAINVKRIPPDQSLLNQIGLADPNQFGTKPMVDDLQAQAAASKVSPAAQKVLDEINPQSGAPSVPTVGSGRKGIMISADGTLPPSSAPSDGIQQVKIEQTTEKKGLGRDGDDRRSLPERKQVWRVRRPK